MKIRLNGLLLLLGTALIAYWYIYSPLRDAAAHLAAVRISTKGAVAVPLGLLFGLGLAIGGPAFAKAVESGPGTPSWMGKMSAAGWVLVAISAAVGLATFFWLQNYLQVHGYSFG